MENLRFVTVRKFAEITGYSEKAIYRKIEDGVFVEGIHFHRPEDNRILMDINGYATWVIKSPRHKKIKKF